jgi:hypothetical protein
VVPAPLPRSRQPLIDREFELIELRGLVSESASSLVTRDFQLTTDNVAAIDAL